MQKQAQQTGQNLRRNLSKQTGNVDKQILRNMDKLSNRDINRQKYRKTGRQIDRKTGKCANIYSEIWSDF